MPAGICDFCGTPVSPGHGAPGTPAYSALRGKLVRMPTGERIVPGADLVACRDCYLAQYQEIYPNASLPELP